MAGNKLTHKSQIKASSILEVLISMVIILVVFGIAMMISANVLRLSLSVKKLRAEALLHDVLIQAEHNNDNTTQTFTFDDIKVEQEIKLYEDDNALIEIHLTAYDTNQLKLTELQKVIFNKND